MKSRFEIIDIIRGTSILAVILIHTSYYFISNPIAAFLWKWSQFAVPAFVFCSAYLFFQKPKTISFIYLKSRLIRLVKPYYIFLLFFLPMLLLINPDKLNFKYIFESIILIGGVDINWLVLLFVYFMILFPLTQLIYKKHKSLFIAYFLISIASSILFIFYKLPFTYKYILWLPWSVIPLFTLFFVKNENKKYFIIITTILTGLIFVFSFYFQLITHRSTGFIENKYPPNFYFLAYGVFSISIIYLLSKQIIKNNFATRILTFFSVYSYPIYFIHYVILIALAKYIKVINFNWATFFLIVLLSTVVIQIGINHIHKKYYKNISI